MVKWDELVHLNEKLGNTIQNAWMSILIVLIVALIVVFLYEEIITKKRKSKNKRKWFYTIFTVLLLSYSVFITNILYQASTEKQKHLENKVYPYIESLPSVNVEVKDILDLYNLNAFEDSSYMRTKEEKNGKPYKAKIRFLNDDKILEEELVYVFIKEADSEKEVRFQAKYVESGLDSFKIEKGYYNGYLVIPSDKLKEYID